MFARQSELQTAPVTDRYTSLPYVCICDDHVPLAKLILYTLYTCIYLKMFYHRQRGYVLHLVFSVHLSVRLLATSRKSTEKTLLLTVRKQNSTLLLVSLTKSY